MKLFTAFFLRDLQLLWNLIVLVKILNTPLLTFDTKNSISDILVVLDTPLEQVLLASLL